MRKLSWCVAAAGLIASPSAFALCTLLCTCTVTTTSLQFGTYNPLAHADVVSTAKVLVKCGGVVGLAIPLTVYLGPGNGTVASRLMASGANRLQYGLYADPTFTVPLGDGTQGTVTIAGNVDLDLLGLSPGLEYTMFGRIPSRQVTTPPGVYADAIPVTLEFY
ncbi:spore coat protein U domain-containing protein [Mitsuaria sp. GD03876]|uniref:spore coat protein U domain-containing protein n=1 Tax=Mitsuaria sp. GD03876 TaxID=2975399 RepID=UPI0024497BE9|nr:spore coat protein U domain-containing protein [Mitsuaria sp. GD03876]MDH0864528.1 spore coat U domain-containing protein [Mitsuaria sp. GD03876]